MTSPTDHQAGHPKVMNSPKKRDRPVITNPQIQAASLKEITIVVMQQAQKKAHLL
jgi:hypothetical protein